MWKKVALRVVLGLIALIIVLIIGALLYIRHHIQYYDGERLDEAALNAKAEEYIALARAVEARPKEDREALDELTKSKCSEQPSKSWIFCGNCSDVVQEIETNSIQTDSLRQFDEKYRAILENGLILQGDIGIEESHSNLINYRSLFDLQMKIALQEGLASHTEMAADRLILNQRLIDGMFDTPILISSMVAISMESRLDQTLIYLLPRLENADVMRLRRSIENRPSALKAVIESIKVDRAIIIMFFNRNPNIGMSAFEVLGKGQVLGWIYNAIYFNAGCMRWERLRNIQMTSELINAYEQWIDQGANDKPMA